MKRVVVVGGAGFIGCHVVHHHIKNGDRVTVIDNLSRRGTDFNLQYIKALEPSLDFVHGDIRIDTEILKKHCRSADIIYHLAAQVAVTTSVTDPRTDFDINALGTFNVLEAAKTSDNDPILIYASTNKVYGGLEDLNVAIHNDRYALIDAPEGVSETRGLDFHSPYGCSKGTGDQYCRDYYRIYGLKTIVMRQSCIYGTRQFGIEDQGWIAHFIISALFERPLTIFGDGMQVRDALWIDDLVNAYTMASENIEKTAGNVYNIGGGSLNTLSLLELVDLMKEQFSSPITPAFADWRPGDQRVFVSNITKAQQDFHWEPTTPPGEGIRLLIQWAKAHKPELARVFAGF